MASERSKQVYRMLFENTFLGANKPLLEIFDSVGYSGYHGSWLDSNRRHITEVRDGIYQLSPMGMFSLMDQPGYKKHYKKEEQGLVLDALKQYHVPMSIGDLFYGENWDNFIIDEAIKLSKVSSWFNEWWISKPGEGEHLYCDDIDYSRYGRKRMYYEYNIPPYRILNKIDDSGLLAELKKRKLTPELQERIKSAGDRIKLSASQNL